MDEEKRAKLSFSIPTKPKPPKPATRPAAAPVHAGPTPRFVTVFDPSETLTPAAAAPVVIPPLPSSHKPIPAAAAPAVVIAPLPNSHEPAPAPAAAPPSVIAPLPNTRKLAEASTTFVLGASGSDSDGASSSAGYGLTVRNTDSKRKLAPEDNAARDRPPPPGPSGEDLMLRRFKEDMEVLPEIQGTEEYDEVPVEGFGAALLAGYGWKEGGPIGRNKTTGKEDGKILERGRRFGNPGIGCP